jgi:hypothetical protein
MPAVVLGLLLGLLAAAVVVRRYQEYKAYQRARLRALVAQSASLERALEQLARIPLSQPLRSALRDCLAREYVAIGKLHKTYPDIRRLIDQSRLRIDQDGGATSGHIPAIGDHAEYLRLLGAIGQVIDLLSSRGATLRNGSRNRSDWMREVRERRAEISARFFIVQAHRAFIPDNRKQSLVLLRTLIEQLYQHGPNTPFVHELIREAQAMYGRAVRGLPLLEGAQADDQGHRSNRSSAA